jgi:hypothetical protein
MTAAKDSTLKTKIKLAYDIDYRKDREEPDVPPRDWSKLTLPARVVYYPNDKSSNRTVLFEKIESLDQLKESIKDNIEFILSNQNTVAGVWSWSRAGRFNIMQSAGEALITQGHKSFKVGELINYLDPEEIEELLF